MAIIGFVIEGEERNNPDSALVEIYTPPFSVKDEIVLLAATLHYFQ